jgi:hypothetical protein
LQKEDADGSKYYEDVSLKQLLLFDRFTTTTYHEGLKLCGVDEYNKDSLVQTVTRPVLDENGNKQYDSEGNVITETITVTQPYDDPKTDYKVLPEDLTKTESRFTPTANP